VAGIALFVAAIGITNTMIMSVVERTHEIGIMKSVGARDRHVLLTFLVEGAIVGVLGAAMAIIVSCGSTARRCRSSFATRSAHGQLQ